MVVMAAALVVPPLLAVPAEATTVSRPGYSATAGLSSADSTFVDETVKREMAVQRIPGVTVAIRAPRVSFIRSYGKADLASGRPLQPDVFFRIASVTKTFVATAALRLVDQHKIGLDDRLSRYVTGVPYGAVITIRELLAMRAGVFNFIDDQKFLAAYAANPLLPGWQPRDVLTILRRNVKLAKPPGQQTVYSDSNYILLGLVMEKVTGKPAEEVVTDEVIRPLHLAHTIFPTAPGLPRPYAHGYDDSLGTLRDATFSTPAVPWTAGAIVSTVPDITGYAKLLADGALLGPKTQAQRLQFAPLGPPGAVRTRYGLGILQVGDWLGHTGAIFGYSCFVFYLPKSDATIVVMGNKATTTGTPVEPIWGALAKHFYPNSLPSP